MSVSSFSDDYTNATFKLNNLSDRVKYNSISDNNDSFDWDKINCNLQLNGFPEVVLKFNDNDELYFDKNGTIALRYLISDLLRKNLKNQDIIRDSFDENDKLKTHLKNNRFIIARYEETIKNLNDSLLETKQKLKEISTTQKNSIYSNHVDKVGDTKEVIANQLAEQSRQIVITRYYNLQQICDEQRQEINTLQIKLNKLTSLEESRRNRQRDIFHQLRNKAPNSYNALDKRLLDIIDSYESKVLQLESHLTFFSNLGFSLPDDDCDIVQNNNYSNNNNNNSSSIQKVEVSDEYKQLISKMQEEIRNVQREKEIVEEKCELLKLESSSKPSLQELKDVIAKLKEYKQLLNFHNIRPEKERFIRTSRQKIDPKSGDYPNQVEDIEFLPLKTCQRYLIDICTHLNANSVTEAFKDLTELLELNTVFPIYFSFFTRFSQLIHTPGLPQLKNVQVHDHSLSVPHTLEVTYNEMVNILELWVHQLCSINQLAGLVEQLKITLLPWHKSGKTIQRPGIHGIIDMLNEVLDECEVEGDSSDTINPTSGQCRGLVEHFQDIFNCPNIIGVYAKMNIVFTKYMEMQNILETIKKILKIENQRGFACIVAEVDGLLDISHMKFTKDLGNFGAARDIEALVSKLEKYEQFVPEFEELVSQITELLGIETIDEIIPRVKALQESIQRIQH